MGWELRNGRRYYYSKKRVNGRVVSSYCGIGLLVELVATMGELSDVERCELKALRQREEAIDARLEGLGAQLQAAIKAGLQAAGFHQHKGTWRKKRMAKALAKTDSQALAALDGIANYLDAYLSIGNWEEANPGCSVPSQLRERFDAAQRANPDLWRATGDLVKLEFDRMIERASPSYPDQQSIRKACEHLEAEQGYATASPLERLSIKEIVLAWLRLHEVQKQHTLAHRGPSLSQSNCEFWDRRLMYAQQRYLRACTALARIRKLLKGVQVQVNVALDGGQQLNIAR